MTEKIYNTDFLRYFFNEDLFLINEPALAYAEKESTQEDIAEEACIPSIEIKGSNKRGILILVNEPLHPFLSGEDMNFLEKILKDGLNMTTEDIALINIHQIKDLKDIEEIQHLYMICFGTKNNFFNYTPPGLYELSKSKGKTVLFADPLKEIATNVAMKKALWKNLKLMFNI